MDMKKSNVNLDDVIKEINSLPDVQKLPQPLKELIKKTLESVKEMKFPVATFMENGEWIAKTPLIDICAQGETQEEAIQSITDMIDDYMSDPHTKKPKIETMINVNIQSIPINLPIDNVATNNTISKDC